MTPEELLTEWTNGERNGLRPKRLQAVRDDLAAATGMAFPRRVSDIEGMMSNQQLRGVVTRKLKEAVEAAEDEAETDDETADIAPEGDGDD